MIYVLLTACCKHATRFCSSVDIHRMKTKESSEFNSRKTCQNLVKRVGTPEHINQDFSVRNRESRSSLLKLGSQRLGVREAE